MPPLRADDGSDLTAVRGQTIDVLALQVELARLHGENSSLRAALADRGSQYCSGDFQDLLTSYGMRSSMSRKGTVGTMPPRRACGAR